MGDEELDYYDVYEDELKDVAAYAREVLAANTAERLSLGDIQAAANAIGGVSAEAIIADVPQRRDGFYGRWSASEGVRPPDLTTEEDMAMSIGCCDQPKPMILHRNNRAFCGNCKRYLDRPAQGAGEEANDDGDTDADQAGDAGPG